MAWEMNTVVETCKINKGNYPATFSGMQLQLIHIFKDLAECEKNRFLMMFVRELGGIVGQ